MVIKLAKTQGWLGFDSSTMKTSQRCRLARMAALAVGAWLLVLAQAHAQTTVTRTANDGFGAAGFNTAAGWSDGLVPSAGNAYFDQNFDLRSPPDANAYTFAGDSLTVADGGRFLFKGTSATAPITINNLILDGGYLRNAQGNAWLLAGSIHLTANGGIVWPSSGAGGTNIASNVDGIGPLAIGGADSGDQSGQVNTLSGTNTYTGQTLLLGGTVTLTGPGALPSGAVLKFGSATPNANSGRATLNLNGGSYTVGGLSVATFNAVTANGTTATPATNGSKVRRPLHHTPRWHSDRATRHSRRLDGVRHGHRLLDKQRIARGIQCYYNPRSIYLFWHQSRRWEPDYHQQQYDVSRNADFRRRSRRHRYSTASLTRQPVLQRRSP